jgi:hypothetical protein
MQMDVDHTRQDQQAACVDLLSRTGEIRTDLDDVPILDRQVSPLLAVWRYERTSAYDYVDHGPFCPNSSRNRRPAASAAATSLQTTVSSG